MKKDKLRLFPMLIMLMAGLITSVLTFYFQYEIKAALLILLSVLLLFYILGLIFVSIVHKFDDINQAEQEKQEGESEEDTLSVEIKDSDSDKNVGTAATEGA